MTGKLELIANKLVSLQNQPGAVFLFPHVGVDGDALGSSLGLLLALRKVKINCRFLYDEIIPDKYAFLPGFSLIENFDADEVGKYGSEQLLAIALDCSDAGRTGQRQALFDLAPEVAVMDHHVSGEESGPLCLIRPEAAATGEIIYDLILLLEKALDVNIMDADIATLLMTALLTDTGRFTFTNTTETTFAIAARLMRYQVDLRQITYRIYDMTTMARFRLTGKLLNETWFSDDGRIALVKVDLRLLESFTADESDLDGIVNRLRNVEGVTVAFLLREMKNGQIRVNIRSGEAFNAALFARRFGGGGHERAAGIQFADIDLSAAAQILIEKAGELLG